LAFFHWPLTSNLIITLASKGISLAYVIYFVIYWANSNLVIYVPMNPPAIILSNLFSNHFQKSSYRISIVMGTALCLFYAFLKPFFACFVFKM